MLLLFLLLLFDLFFFQIYLSEVKLLTNPGKLSLAKGIAMFLSAFFPKSPNQESKDQPDSIIVDI